MIPRPRATAWMCAFQVGTLVLLLFLRPDQHGATPTHIAEEDFSESYRWRMSYEDWRREHPGAARMLDQLEREIKEKRQRRLPNTCSVDCR
jgi:hypothetical protein